ncbi:MAG: lmo0937 family membrane protein [Acidobacteria bacterium]|nr:lmo0937 family membrane protein [Acidobacteriota bacterium]
MLETIIIILVVGWALGFFAFRVTSALIHILLVVAVVFVILRLLRGRKRTDS